MKPTRKRRGVFDQVTPLDQAAGAVLTLGALNWGLVGAANFDLVRAALGRSAIRRAAYGLMGASAAYALVRGRQLAKG
jgi:uncharacterized membrane protein YuzA (DUF378 family)